jgi:hypothetical protein
MKKLILASAIALASYTGTQAQVSGVALAALGTGNPLAGFIGPWRATATGVDILYTILCYDTVTREKRISETFASIPDGSSLATMRALATTAVVDECAQGGIIVPRGAVLLPSIQLGQ